MRTARAFTLVEVLVALAVLAIGLGALVRGASEYTGNAASLRQRAAAGWVAENQLTELQLAADWPAVGRRDGREELGGIEWHWEVQVQATPNPDIRRATMEVRRADGDAVLARLEGFVGNPQVVAKQ